MVCKSVRDKLIGQNVVASIDSLCKRQPGIKCDMLHIVQENGQLGREVIKLGETSSRPNLRRHQIRSRHRPRPMER
jgi:hypothetical protein